METDRNVQHLRFDGRCYHKEDAFVEDLVFK